MNKTIITLFIASVTASGISAQEQKQQSPEERAMDMANKMEEQLKLTPAQTFYVDSILTHDYREWMDEMEKYQKAGVQEMSIYSSVRDKWAAQIDSSLVKVLSPEQFIGYQKLTGTYKKPKKEKKSGK